MSRAKHPTSERSRFATRLVGFLAGFATLLTILLVSGGDRKTDSALLQPRAVRNADRILQHKLDGRRLHVFLGDSLSFPHTSFFAVPGILQHWLRDTDQKKGVQMSNLSVPGFTNFTHYFLSDRVADLQPDRVIIAVNLRWWSRSVKGQQPNFAALMPASRWTEMLRLPLQGIGLAAAQIATYRALYAFGLLDLWIDVQQMQTNFESEVSNLAEWFNQPAGGGLKTLKNRLRNRVFQDGIRRVSVGGAHRQLGPVFAGLSRDDAGLQVLGATAAHLSARGAEVLIFVQPINVSHLNKIGVLDQAGLAISLGQIQRTAAENGADFLDLHDLLNEISFADAQDHLQYDARGLPAAKIAKELLPWSRRGGTTD